MKFRKDYRGIDYLVNQYDSQGRVSQQTSADGGVWQFAYTTDMSGNIIQTNVTDPRGYVREVTFNTSSYFGGGHATGQTLAAGTSIQQVYSVSLQSGTNLPLSVTDPLSRVTALTYDSNGNVLTVTKAYGTSSAATTTFTYDATFNQVTSISDPLSHTMTYTLNSTGDPVTVADPLSHSVTVTYNAAGQPLTVTTAAGTTSFAYSLGDLVAITDPLGNASRQTLDAVGRVVNASDPLGNLTSYAWDSVNDLLRTTDALGGITSFNRDQNGNLTSLTDALLNTTSWSWDNMDRVASRTDALTHSESYSHDLNGNLSGFTDRKSQATGYTYDGLNRLTQITYADSSTVSLTYDAGNRITQIVDSISGTITRTYDTLDRLTNETTPQGSVSYTYDAANRRASMTVYGQSAVNYTWDNANRLTQIAQSSATVALGYDSANRRTSLTLPNGIAAACGYDAASNLTSIAYTNGSTAVGNLTYTYDADGRRTSVGGTLTGVNLPAALSSAAYNANNQLTQWGSSSLTYDLDGNLTNDGTNSYSWDARNQLSSVGSSSFAYDSFGRRTQNAAGTGFLYDGVNSVQELSGSTVTANLLGGPRVDEVFTRTDSAGARDFLLDALGSTEALTDSSGTIQTQYTYGPFGSTTSGGSSSTSAYQFTGRESDGTGLYYYRARYYNPTTGGFLSEDPAGLRGGSANFYEYVLDNPMSFEDPFGMQCEPKCFAQLKTRPVDDWRAKVVGATHSFWYVQGSSGTQYIISGGPQTVNGNSDLNVWLNKNINNGIDNVSSATSWNSGLLPNNCVGVDGLINAANNWPKDTVPYNAQNGPNSNSAAHYLGTAGGFSPPAPSGSIGWNAPVPIP